MTEKRPGSTRRHFLGVTAAAAGKLTAAAAAMSSVLPPSTAWAKTRLWNNRGGSKKGGHKGRGNKNPQCFLKGTLIGTPTGLSPIEALRIGDLVTTADGQSKPVKWIGRRLYRKNGTSWQQPVVPVKIAAHAIARDVPSRDLYVSPGHALLIDGLLIQAADLVNGVSVSRTTPTDGETIEYLHILLDSHEAIFADGVPAETLLLEPGVHENYTNFAEFLRLYPEQITPPMRRLAPAASYSGRLHLKGLMRAVVGPFAPPAAHVERIYERILERAG
jgi:hypothetical protein